MKEHIDKVLRKLKSTLLKCEGGDSVYANVLLNKLMILVSDEFKKLKDEIACVNNECALLRAENDKLRESMPTIYFIKEEQDAYERNLKADAIREAVDNINWFKPAFDIPDDLMDYADKLEQNND